MMQYRDLACIFLFFLFSSVSLGKAQSDAFNRSDSLFKVYINSDAAKAAGELELQGSLELDSEGKGGYWLNVGLFMLRVGQLDSALAANAKGLAFLQDKIRKGKGLRYRGKMFQTLDQQDSSLKYLKQSLAITPESETSEVLVIRKDLAEIFLRLGKPDSTRHYLNEGMKILDSKDDPSLLEDRGIYLSANGQLQLYLSRYDSAMISFHQAVALYKQTGNLRRQASSLSQIGDILSIQGKHREAIGYYREAVESLGDSPNPSLLGSYSNNLGLVYFRLEELDSARFCFDRSLTIAKQIGRPRLKANSHGNLANIFIKTGEMDSAFFHANASYQGMKGLRNAYGICISLMILAEVDLSRNQIGKGFKELRESRVIAEKLNIPDLEKDAYLALSEAHSKHGSSDSALFFFKEHIAVKDSITSESVKKETERLRIQYETLLKEEENSRLVAELDWEMEKRDRERLTLVVIGLSIALLLLALTLSLYLRNQSRKRELLISEAEARHEKSEKARAQKRLAKALKQITEKDFLLNRLEEDYRDTVSQGSFADKLHERINSNQDWMQFVIEFEMVYKGFFDSLQPQENKLTKTDLRMAALIKLNLSNKEIAEVLSITLEGVKKAKHRLKKKLQLPIETNLSDFVTQASI